MVRKLKLAKSKELRVLRFRYSQPLALSSQLCMLIFFMSIGFSTYAETVAVSEESMQSVVGVEEKVEFEGEATIEGDDQVKARKGAITEGLRALLEDRAKREMTAEQYESLQETVEGQILKNPFKFIKKYSVLKSSVEEELYKVTVTGKLHESRFREAVALVKASTLEEAQSKVLIMLGEKSVDAPVYRYWWGREDNSVKDLFFWTSKEPKVKEEPKEEVLEVELEEAKEPENLELTLSHQAFLSRLQKNGYGVLELTDKLKEQLPSTYHKLDLSSEELKEVARLYDVQHVLHGRIWSESQKGDKTKTFVKLHFYSLAHEKDLLYFSQSYKTPLNEKILKGISYVVLKKLGQNLLTKSYTSKDFEIIVRHPHGFSSFQKARAFLKSFSGSLIEKSMKKGQTRFRIKTTKSMSDIAELIAREKGYEIGETTDGVLNITVSEPIQEKNDAS